MQIHELNNFTGTLGAGAYLAVDDGNDTGKLSTQQLLAATEARIDNIIAGPAPSAEEIVDARYGADGVTYPSLGDAIRDQVTDLKDDLTLLSVGNPALGTFVKNSYINKNDGSFASAGSWSRTDYVAVNLFDNITAKSSASSTYNAIYDKSKAFISAFTVDTTDTLIELPSNAYYVAFSNTNAGMASLEVSGALKTSVAVDHLDHNLNNLIQEVGGTTFFYGHIGGFNTINKIGSFSGKSGCTYKISAMLESATTADVYFGALYNNVAVASTRILAGDTSGSLRFEADETGTYEVYMQPMISLNQEIKMSVIDVTGALSGLDNEVINIYGSGFIYPVKPVSGNFVVKVATYSVLTFILRDGSYIDKAILADTEYTLSPNNALVLDALDSTIKIVASHKVKPWHGVLLQTGAYDQTFNRYITGFFAERITASYEDILLHNVNPDYVRDVDNVISEIVNDNPSDFTAIIGTDMHIPTPTPYSVDRPILNVINRVQSRIQADALLNLGDNVNMGKENTNEAYYSSQQATGDIDDHNNAYFVVGNHDYNNISGVDVYRQKKEWIVPDEAIYRMYGKLHENDVVWGSRDKVYYYKDFEEKKIRMIVLNTLDKPNDTVTIDGVEYEKYPWLPNIVSADQVDWFIDEALDFSDKSDKASWSVLVLSHVTPAPNVEWNSASLGDLQNSNPQGAQIIKIAEAFATGTSKALSYTDTLYGGSATLNRNADFTAQGAIPIIGWLSGHCHIDTKTTINGITYVTTVCGYPDASIGQSSSMSGMEMVDGTYSAFGVDVLSLDKTTRKVKLHRIGIGNDREWTY